MIRSSGNHLGIVLSVTAIIALAALFFAPALFTEKVIWTADKTNWNPWSELALSPPSSNISFSPDYCLSYYPRRVTISEAWRKKEIPFWNPYSFCGTPFLADIQAGVFYPINWLLIGLDPIRQFPPFLFFHMVWGAVGLFLFLRKLGVPAWCGWGGAMAFALNEYFVKNIGLPTFAATASWVPWIFLATEALVERPGSKRAALLAVVWCLAFLSGQPQTVIHAVYAVAIYLGVRFFVRRRPADHPARPGKIAVAFAGAALLALCLSAVQLIPTIDLASRSGRINLSYATVLSGSFHPVEFIRFAVPDFLGTTVTADSWSFLFTRGNNYFLRISFSALFAGTPIFILALWGSISKKTRRRALPFTILFLLFLGLAFGTPITRFAYEYLPGFKFSRIDRAGYFLILAQVILASYGAMDLAKRGG